MVASLLLTLGEHHGEANRQPPENQFNHAGSALKGSIAELPRVVFRRFRSLTATRANAAEIQIDGELVDAPRELHVEVAPRCLSVLVPRR